MSNQLKYTDPAPILEGMKTGGFMRLVMTENGPFTQIEMTAKEFIMALSTLMIEFPPALQDVRIALQVVDAYIKDPSKDPADIAIEIIRHLQDNCTCDKCTARRSEKERLSKNN